MNEQYSFPHKVAIAVFIAILIILSFAAVGYAFQFFLLIFGSILLAVLLRAGTNWLKDKTGMADGLALGIVFLLSLGVIVAGIWLLVPTIAAQIDEMRETLPAALRNLESQLSEHPLGKRAVDQFHENRGEFTMEDGEMFDRATGVFSSTLGALADFFIMVIIGIFFAASPETYHKGIVKLFPPRNRQRVSSVLHGSYYVLKSWLLGKLLTMLFVGVASGILLVVLGVPLPIALGVIAFFLDFIPTIGPLIAAVPAILIAFLDGPMTALWVAIGYFVIQSIESYVLVPYIYKKTVHISPVITLGSLVFFGIIAGPVGIVLATPLVAVLQYMIGELYIHDYLEEGGKYKHVPEGEEQG
jgi:predicted PurR-regulated permease PerM